MGLGERVCCRAGLAVRGGTEGLVDKGFALRGGTGGAFRSRHSSLTWQGTEHLGLATVGLAAGTNSVLSVKCLLSHSKQGVRWGDPQQRLPKSD